MAIYIKGVEMPKCCAVCDPDFGIAIGCDKWKTEKFDFINERPPNCPLTEVPEPHGRLIDADEFCIGLYERWETADKDGEKVISSVLADVVVPIIVSTPTVIEGSE